MNAQSRPEEERPERSVTTEPSVPETDDTWPTVVTPVDDPDLATRQREALDRLRPKPWKPDPRMTRALDNHIVHTYGAAIAAEYGVRRRRGPGHR